MAEARVIAASAEPKLRRALGLRDLMLYGIVVVQPTAPMPVFGVVSERARGHVETAVLLAFMGVNAASLVHYSVRSPKRGWKDFVPPELGFFVCLLLWWNLNPTAKIGGSI